MDKVIVGPSIKDEHQDGQALKEETKEMAKSDPNSTLELSTEAEKGPHKEQVGDSYDNTASKPISEVRCSSSNGSRHPSGAEASSSAPGLPLGGAEEPNEKLDMAKMVALLSKSGSNSTPVVTTVKDTPSLNKIATNITAPPDMAAMMSNGGMPDMAAMMAKSGMPDMAAIMAKGGIPDMAAMMAKSGMPDMAAIMAKGGMPDIMAKGGMPDMMAMIGAGAGPLGMKKMMDCIIEVTFARPDSDESDDDEDSVTIEIPCKYCSRFFTSQMSLKTHILVAHDHQDTSVLNVRRIVIDSKSKCGVKEKPHRKQSKDSAVSAASSHVESVPSDKMPVAKVALTQEHISAADADKGTKRNRIGSGECKASLSDAASSDGMQPPVTNKAPKSSAVSSSEEAVSDSVSGSRKRKAPSSSQSELGDSSVLTVSKRGKIDRGSKQCDAEDIKDTAQSPTSAIASGVKPEDGAQLKQVNVSKEYLSQTLQTHRSLKGKSSAKKEKEGVLNTNKDLCLESKKTRSSSRPARHRDQQSTKNESVTCSAEANVSESTTVRNLRSRKSR